MRNCNTTKEQVLSLISQLSNDAFDLFNEMKTLQQLDNDMYVCVIKVIEEMQKVLPKGCELIAVLNTSQGERIILPIIRKKDLY